MSATIARPWTYLELSSGALCLVDDDDLPLLEGVAWHVSREGRCIYVVGRRRGANANLSYLRMHRVIMGATDPKVWVDHENGNGLDNRRANLRLATNSQNQRNRQRFATGHSSYKGVTLHRATGRWMAQIKADGKNHYLGLFDEEAEAARAYDAAAVDRFGSFAAINFGRVSA